jgi:gliding motility-associated lipoprotein GldH
MKKILLLPLLLLFAAACGHYSGDTRYTSFPDQTWHRFDILKYRIPVRAGKEADVYLLAYTDSAYPYSTLDFYSTLRSPSGEERMREFHVPVKDSAGRFSGVCAGDSCLAKVALIRGFRFTEKGDLTVELENLIPRLKTTGLRGVGIRVEYR